MTDKEKELLGQFHHTISEQLNSRLSESPKFFGLLVVVSTGYGYVLFDPQLSAHKALFALASFLAYASVLWATWYLAALGYAFRFLQNIQHCVEQKIGWAGYTPHAEDGRRTGQPPKPIRIFSSEPFWLLPGIYHAHAAGLGVFLMVICAAFGWNAWKFWHNCFVIVVFSVAVLFGLAWILRWNLHYLKRFSNKWRNPREELLDSTKIHASLDSLFAFKPDGEGNFIAHPPKEEKIHEARKWVLESFQRIVSTVDVPTGLPHRVGRVLELLRDYELEHEPSEKARSLWQQIKKQMHED